MSATSPRHALPMLQPGQAQKELFHNEALLLIDAALHPTVAASPRNDAPTAPAIGACWIVGTSPLGDWAGHAGAIAMWTAGGWRFVAARAGMSAWLADQHRWTWHDGAAWQAGPLPTGGIAVNGVRVTGPQQPAIVTPTGGSTVDGEARTALSQILTALREHGLIATA